MAEREHDHALLGLDGDDALAIEDGAPVSAESTNTQLSLATPGRPSGSVVLIPWVARRRFQVSQRRALRRGD
eukprot:2234609-Pyramimonas_sp.AAC.1